MKLRHLILALAVCGLCYAAKLATQRFTPAFPNLAVTIEGAFSIDGQYEGEPLVHAAAVRKWGSWAGNDANTGLLTLGPFPAPARLRLAVGGYPTHEGNQLYLELAETKTREPIKIIFDIGERWRLMDVDVPAAWIGKPITLCARDANIGLGGWLAVTEPLSGGFGSGNGEFFETLAGWSINGLLLGLLWFAALRHVTAHGWVAPHWAPLVAAGFVAACGYAAFWAFFANALFGKIFSAALLVLGAAGALRPRKSNDLPGTDAMLAPKLLLAIGTLYIALLHFFPSSLEFYQLAANRFRAGLPGDNNLPQYFGDFLFHGLPLRLPGADWLSSDRPPLQIGWLMLTWPVSAALQLEARSAGGTAAVWFQSLWIFGAYGLLRTLGFTRARAAAWLAVMALAGFFVQNTLFTWPKLSAAAFACGAFGLWLFPRRDASRKTELLLGAVLAGLAWLSHGGVAFSFLALTPCVAWRALRGEWRGWILAALVFLALAGPWVAYQKFYDPPGNRLFKWHLAGVAPKDERGTWQTIRESYAKLTWTQFVADKKLNFSRQLEGDWSWWHNFSQANAAARRNDEFFFTARALTWWLLGFAALPVVLLKSRTRARLRETWPAHATLAAWTFLAVVVWCLLMFTGGQAVIHQGSYAVMLGLFVLLSVWCECAGAWTLAIVGALQALSFATTWAVANDVVHGPLNFLALSLAITAAVALVAFVVREHRTGE